MARRLIELPNLTDQLNVQRLREYLLDLFGYVALKVNEAFVETTGATVTTLLTVPLVDDKTSQVSVDVVARRTGGSAGASGDGASYRVVGTFRRVGAGSATLIGSLTTVHSAESQAGWDCTLTASGNDVLVRVTGATNNNVSWAAVATVQTV